MPFGVVSGVGLGVGVLDFGGDRRRGRGSVGGEFAVVIELSFGVVCGVGSIYKSIVSVNLVSVLYIMVYKVIISAASV